MAIIIKTKVPNTVISDIRQKIDLQIIRDWTYDEDGDLTSAREQWKNKAWFHPFIYDDLLAFELIGRRNVEISIEEYSFFYGNFVEMLIYYIGEMIDDMSITKMKSK